MDRWHLGGVHVVDGAEEALGAEPGALRWHGPVSRVSVARPTGIRARGERAHLEERRPVDAREDVLLEVEVKAVGHVLRAEDGRKGLGQSVESVSLAMTWNRQESRKKARTSLGMPPYLNSASLRENIKKGVSWASADHHAFESPPPQSR